MTDDVGQGFLSDPEKHGALGVAKGFDTSEGCQVNFDFTPFRHAPAVGMKGGNESEVVQHRRTQFPGKAMNSVYRIFHQLLGVRYFRPESVQADRGDFTQGGELHINAYESLNDFVVQFTADFLPLLLLGGDNLPCQQAELFLHEMRFFKQASVFFSASM